MKTLTTLILSIALLTGCTTIPDRYDNIEDIKLYREEYVKNEEIVEKVGWSISEETDNQFYLETVYWVYTFYEIEDTQYRKAINKFKEIAKREGGNRGYKIKHVSNSQLKIYDSDDGWDGYALIHVDGIIYRVDASPEPVAKEEPKAEPKKEAVPAAYKAPDVIMQGGINFDFDKASLTPAAQDNLLRKAEWLRENSDVTVTIEGHCDARGTNEYNLALGDRRAESAKAFLVDLGIAASRVTTISYGEERPVCTQKNEECWAKNRRANFVVD